MSYEKPEILWRNYLEQFSLAKKFAKLNNLNAFTQTTAVAPIKSKFPRVVKLALVGIDFDWVLFNDGTRYEWEQI